MSSPHFQIVGKKFLFRNLRISDDSQVSIQKVFVKRVFLKKFYDERKRNRQGATHTIQNTFKAFKSNKLLKNVQHFQTSHLSSPYIQECLKKSQIITSLSIEVDSGSEEVNEMDNMEDRENNNLYQDSLALRRLLPKHLKRVQLSMNQDQTKLQNEVLYKFARILQKLRKLQNYLTWFAFSREIQRAPRSVARELNISGDLNWRYFQRQNTGQIFMLPGDPFGKNAKFKRYPVFLNVDELDITFRCSAFDNVCQLVKFVESRKSRGISGKENSLEKNSIMKNQTNPVLKSNICSQQLELFGAGESREALKPFLRFEFFWNLSKLHLINFEVSFPLGNYIVDGFKCLGSLQDFKITTGYRSRNVSPLFDALLYLPPLKKFSIAHSSSEDTLLTKLEEFLSGQNKLENLSLSLRIRCQNQDSYTQHNSILETIVKNFKNKPMLKCLKIMSNYWSLESVARGFSQFSKSNQLESLKLQASDDTITSKEIPCQRIQGLCQFIENQSNSLKRLQISPNLVLEEHILKGLSQAISKVTELKELDLSINQNYGKFINYFEKSLQQEIEVEHRKKLQRIEAFNPSVALYLRDLQKLESLSLEFDMIYPSPDDSYKWFEEVVQVLICLKNLRTLFVKIGSNVPESFEESLIYHLEKLQNIKKIGGECGNSSKLKNALEKMCETQKQKCDLMF